MQPPSTTRITKVISSVRQSSPLEKSGSMGTSVSESSTGHWREYIPTLCKPL